MLKLTQYGKSGFLFGLWLMLVSISSAAAVEKTADRDILAVGTAAISQENLAQAKESAISHALTKGIENYLVTRLGRDGMINNFERIVQDILPHAGEGIENFHILASDRIGDQYSVLIRLRINREVMDKKLRTLGITVIKGPAVKVLFMVSRVEDGSIRYWWGHPDEVSTMDPVELSLYRVFQERGFSPLMRSSAIPEAELTDAMKSPELTNDMAAAWGRLLKADLVITGRWIMSGDDRMSLMLKPVMVSNRSSIFRAERTAVMEKDEQNAEIAKSQTLGRLVDDISSEMIPVIIRAFEMERGHVNHIPITLTGLESYRQFKDFRAFLTKYVPGVKSVKQTRVTKNSISLEVGFEGDKAKLLESILKNEKLPLLMDGRITEEGEIIIEIE